MARKQTKTTRVLKSLKRGPEIKTPIAKDMFIPNHSGLAVHREFKNNTFWKNDGTYTRLKTAGPIIVDADEKIHFRDGDVYIHSCADGCLKINSDFYMEFKSPDFYFENEASTDVDLIFDGTGIGQGKITYESDNDLFKITTSNLLLSKKLQFDVATNYIQSTGTNLQFVSPTLDFNGATAITFSNEIDMEANGMIVTSLRNFWAFKFADGLGANNTGLYFNLTSGEYQFTFTATNIFRIGATGVVIGAGTADVDYTLTFDGDDNDGIITWMEEEDYFKFSDDILLNGTEAIGFTDFNTKLVYANSGDLDLYTPAEKTLELQTTVFEDIQFGISNARVPASNAPTWQTFTTNTNEYGFDVDDYIDCEANELPHSWAEGTNARPHLHITTKAANASGVNQYAKFTVYIAYADTNEAWTETSFTAELTIPNGTGVLTNMFLDLGTDLVLTNYLIGTQVKVRIERIDATSGDPTEYPGQIFITQVGLHAAMNTLGSRQLLVK